MLNKSKQIGDLGEEIARDYLVEQGYEIVSCNYRSRFGEIDIIASNSEYLVFVEVKMRKNAYKGNPAEYVTSSKQRKIILTAMHYLSLYENNKQPRFDVIEILMKRINHIPNAFGVSNNEASF